MNLKKTFYENLCAHRSFLFDNEFQILAKCLLAVNMDKYV